jgi:hypothetical protein
LECNEDLEESAECSVVAARRSEAFYLGGLLLSLGNTG